MSIQKRLTAIEASATAASACSTCGNGTKSVVWVNDPKTPDPPSRICPSCGRERPLIEIVFVDLHRSRVET